MTIVLTVGIGISQFKWLWYSSPGPLGDLVKFDSASRGIWGSFNLLARLRFHLVSLGAIVTIVSTASDPFIQQVVRYRSCARAYENGVANISRINQYRDYTSVRDGSELETLGLDMQAALYKGVYDSFEPVQATCSTGNCTFPDYRTVGMCSACEDISSQIDILQEEMCVDYIIRLPSGLNLTHEVGQVVNLGPDNPTAGIDAQFPYATNIMYWDESVDAAYPSVDNATACSKWIKASAVALNCTLFPCVRTYSTNVTSGQTSEILLSTTNMASLDIEWADAYSDVPMPCLINGSYYTESAFAVNGTVYNISWVDGPVHQTFIPPQCYYNLSTQGLLEYLPSFLNGYLRFAPEDDYADPAWVGQLYSQGNVSFDTIDAFWGAIAESLTVTIRQSADALVNGSNPTTRSYATGTAYNVKTCITVEWPWLSLPAFLIILTILFLVVTMVKSRHAILWKASPLALLVCGLEQDLRDELHKMHEFKAVGTLAEKMIVQLADLDGQGMSFVDVSQRSACWTNRTKEGDSPHFRSRTESGHGMELRHINSSAGATGEARAGEGG